MLIALPAIRVSSQYFEKDVAASLSYMARDGWCEVGVSPEAGFHCFGDYASQALTAEHDFSIGDRDFTKGPYTGDPNAAYNSLYRPIGQFRHVVSDLIREGFAGRQPAFYTYFAFLLLAVLTPAIWLAWLWRRSALLLIPVVVIGIAALPVIAVLDRANGAGFVVPLLLAFVLFLRRDPPWLSPAMAVGAALIRPRSLFCSSHSSHSGGGAAPWPRRRPSSASRWRPSRLPPGDSRRACLPGGPTSRSSRAARGTSGSRPPRTSPPRVRLWDWRSGSTAFPARWGRSATGWAPPSTAIRWFPPRSSLS